MTKANKYLEIVLINIVIMFIFYHTSSNTQKVIDSLQSRCTLIKIKPIQKNFLKKFIIKLKIMKI